MHKTICVLYMEESATKMSVSENIAQEEDTSLARLKLTLDLSPAPLSNRNNNKQREKGQNGISTEDSGQMNLQSRYIMSKLISTTPFAMVAQQLLTDINHLMGKCLFQSYQKIKFRAGERWLSG